jgi:hypothetical protein
MAKHQQEPPHYDPPRIHPDSPPKHRGEDKPEEAPNERI